MHSMVCRGRALLKIPGLGNGTEEFEMTVKQFEGRVFEVEEIRIVVRGPKSARVQDYDYTRKFAKNKTLSELKSKRLRPKLTNGKSLYDVAIIMGDGKFPRDHMTLKTVRDSYIRDAS